MKLMIILFISIFFTSLNTHAFEFGIGPSLMQSTSLTNTPSRSGTSQLALNTNQLAPVGINLSTKWKNFKAELLLNDPLNDVDYNYKLQWLARLNYQYYFSDNWFLTPQIQKNYYQAAYYNQRNQIRLYEVNQNNIGISVGRLFDNSERPTELSVGYARSFASTIKTDTDSISLNANTFRFKIENHLEENQRLKAELEYDDGKSTLATSRLQVLFSWTYLWIN